MKKFFFFLLLLIGVSSCFLTKQYKQATFFYSDASGAHTIPIVIPKGYTSAKSNVNAAGNTESIYEYEAGAVLYVAHLKDTTKEYISILREAHIPREHPLGGIIYKGVDLNLRFWREIRRGNFRFGYKNVPSNYEGQFDSATNFMSLQKLR